MSTPEPDTTTPPPEGTHAAPSERGKPETPVPAPRGAAGVVEPAGEVVEGELLSEEENAALAARLAAPPPAERGVLLRVIASPPAIRAHTLVLAPAGHALCCVYRGWQSWAHRAWDAATWGVYRRQIKAAEALGDPVLLAEWIERHHAARERRHHRLMALPQLAVAVTKLTLGVLGGLLVLTLATGLLAQLCGAGSFLGVLRGARDLLWWVFTLLSWAAPLCLAMVPLVGLVAGWREGGRCTPTPGWVATTGEDDTDITIDETTVAAALAALRIAQITAYLKKGYKIQYPTLIHASGRGVHMVIRLPAGVPAKQIARRRADLATGLHRLAKEVWPSTGSEEGLLDLWIAHKGALAQGAGPYPLLTEGSTDVFAGVPFGRTLRGDPIMAPLMGRNTIVGGIPGQGKSAAARVLLAGAALDPTAELRIWVPDSNFDFEAFKRRASRYVMGAEHHHIEEILTDLQDLHAEVQARGELLVKYETDSVTRTLANQNIGLHPLFGLLEEAHVAIQHPKYGDDIAQYLVDIVRLGRKRGIHLIISTQAPTAKSIPRDLTRNCSNGIAFAVGDHVANDALLGEGAYAGGHRATELIPGTDIGTAVVKGFTGARSEMIQAYFLGIAKGRDQVSPIITRSLDAITDRGDPPPGERSTTPALPAPRDLLTDLDQVLGSTPLPAADIPPLLARLAPDHRPYQQMTGQSLRSALAALGIKVPTTGNRHPVDPLTIRHTLAQRATLDLDDINPS